MRKTLLTLFLLPLFTLNAFEMFIVNSVSETLSKYDTDTGVIDNEFCQLGLYTNRIALNWDYGYVVNSGDNTIQKINLDTGSTISNIFVAPGCNPYDIILDGNNAYVSGLLTNSVYKIDLNTNNVVGIVAVGSGPAGLEVYDNKLYVACSGSYPNYSNAEVSVINLSDFTLSQSVPVEGNAQYIYAIESMIHVVCSSDWGANTGEIDILNPETNTIVETIPLGGYLGNAWYSGNGNVYVSDGNNAGLYAYNPISFEEVYTYDNSFSTSGSLVSGTPDKLFIVDSQWGENGVLKVFNLDEEYQTELSVGIAPTDIKIRPNAISNEDVVQPQIQVSVYPNPFVDSINIKTDTDCTFICYNLKGQVVHRDKLKSGNTGLKTSNLPSGVYFYKVIDANNNQTTGKMLKIK